MQRQSTHYRQIGHLQYHYTFFDSVSDYHDWIEEELKSLSYGNRMVLNEINRSTAANIHAGSRWYGTPIPRSVQELVNHTSFLGMRLAGEMREKVREYLAQYLRNLSLFEMPLPALAYNDRGIGVFSFERAAMGLYKHTPIKTSTPLAKMHSMLQVATNQQQVTTNNQKVYAAFENKETSRPGVQLYLVAGGNCDIEGNDMLYVGLGCAELICFLEARGVATEVNVLNATQFGKDAIVGVIRVKRFQDKLDLNQILLMSSDPRYFRYKGFLGLIALSNLFRKLIPDDLGHSSKVLGYNFVSALHENKRNKGFVFEHSYSLDACAKEVKRIIKLYQAERAYAHNH